MEDTLRVQIHCPCKSEVASAVASTQSVCRMEDNMKRRAMAGLLAMTMAATMFAGCGSTAADSQTADAQGSARQQRKQRQKKTAEVLREKESH